MLIPVHVFFNFFNNFIRERYKNNYKMFGMKMTMLLHLHPHPHPQQLLLLLLFLLTTIQFTPVYSIGYIDIPQLANCPANLSTNYGTTVSQTEYATELLTSGCTRVYTEVTDADKLALCFTGAGDTLEFDDLARSIRENYCSEACDAAEEVDGDDECDTPDEDEEDESWCDFEDNEDYTERIYLTRLSEEYRSEVLQEICDKGAQYMDSSVVPLITDQYGAAAVRMTMLPSTIPSIVPSIVPSAAPELPCNDTVTNWEDSTGATCTEYADNTWCVEYGDEYAGTANLTANEVCCACGGGVDVILSFVFEFRIQASDAMPLTTADILGGEGSVGDELLVEVRRILLASDASMVAPSTIALTFMAVEACDTDTSINTCYDIVLRVNLSTYDSNVTTAQLEAVLREGQQDGYYYHENIDALVAAPELSESSNDSNVVAPVFPESSGSSNDNDIIYISVAIVLVFIIIGVVVLLRKKYMGKESKQMEDVTNRDFVFEDIIDRELQSPPKSPEILFFSHDVQEQAPKLDVTDAAIIMPGYQESDFIQDISSQPRSVSFQVPDYGQATDDSPAGSAPDFVEYAYENTNTSMEATIETRVKPCSFNHGSENATWGMAPSVSTTDSPTVNDLQLESKSSYADQAIEALGLNIIANNMDNMCATLQTTMSPSDSNANGRNDYDPTISPNPSIGTIDDGSTWATEESRSATEYRSAAHANATTDTTMNKINTIGNAFTGGLGGFLATVPEDTNMDNSSNSGSNSAKVQSQQYSASKEVLEYNSPSANSGSNLAMVQSQQYSASQEVLESNSSSNIRKDPLSLSRTRTTDTTNTQQASNTQSAFVRKDPLSLSRTRTTDTTNTQQASNTQSAVLKRHIITQSADETPPPLVPHMLDGTSDLNIIDDADDIYGAIPMSHTYPKAKSPKRYNDQYADDSSLGSLGDLSSSVDGSSNFDKHNYARSGARMEPRSIPTNIVAGSLNLKSRSPASNPNNALRNTSQSSRSKTPTSTNAEFNDWLQNEIDSLKQKGSWQDIERLIEKTPEYDNVQSREGPEQSLSYTQNLPVAINPSPSMDSMPDDEKLGQSGSMANQNLNTALPLTNVRRMYT